MNFTKSGHASTSAMSKAGHPTDPAGPVLVLVPQPERSQAKTAPLQRSQGQISVFRCNGNMRFEQIQLRGC